MGIHNLTPVTLFDRGGSTTLIHNAAHGGRAYVSNYSSITFIMSLSIKIGHNGACPTCESKPNRQECAQCLICKSVFHAWCEKKTIEENCATKTMVKSFNLDSTKNNFAFFCDVCATEFERSQKESEREKIDGLETKVNKIEAKIEEKFEEMTRLLLNQEKSRVPKPIPNNIWNDPGKMAVVKTPPLKLVIKSKNDATIDKAFHSKLEKAMQENSIGVSNCYKNKSGDIHLQVESEEKRNQLKNLVSNQDDSIEMNTPSEQRASITIVGLQEEYKKDEVLQMLELQNGFIKAFASSNRLQDHIEIFSVQPLKNNPQRFQVFASVSPTLREGILMFGNKLTLGFNSCKVYDRVHVKRCYTCQHFGHYMKDCPTPDRPVCGKCASHHHNTRDCTSFDAECINCVRSDRTDTNHHTNSVDCPMLMNEQEKLKHIAASRLNLPIHNHAPRR